MCLGLIPHHLSDPISTFPQCIGVLASDFRPGLWDRVTWEGEWTAAYAGELCDCLVKTEFHAPG